MSKAWVVWVQFQILNRELPHWELVHLAPKADAFGAFEGAVEYPSLPGGSITAGDGSAGHLVQLTKKMSGSQINSCVPLTSTKILSIVKERRFRGGGLAARR